jgi:hypothetical protein
MSIANIFNNNKNPENKITLSYNTDSDKTEKIIDKDQDSNKITAILNHFKQQISYAINNDNKIYKNQKINSEFAKKFYKIDKNIKYSKPITVNIKKINDKLGESINFYITLDFVDNAESSRNTTFYSFINMKVFSGKSVFDQNVFNLGIDTSDKYNKQSEYNKLKNGIEDIIFNEFSRIFKDIFNKNIEGIKEVSNINNKPENLNNNEEENNRNNILNNKKEVRDQLNNQFEDKSGNADKINDKKSQNLNNNEETNNGRKNSSWNNFLQIIINFFRFIEKFFKEKIVNSMIKFGKNCFTKDSHEEVLFKNNMKEMN